MPKPTPLRRRRSTQPGNKARRRASGRKSLAVATREDRLLAQLKTAEESLRAIPSRHVDALVVFSRRGAHVVTLQGGDSAYRMLVEAMSEGAATVSREGVLLYCNRRFADWIGRAPAQLMGTEIHSLVDEAEREKVQQFLQSAQHGVVKGEFLLRARKGAEVPVHFSLSPLRGYRGQAYGMVITDLTEQRRKQQEEIKRSEAAHRLLLERELQAQEAERRRIARELHDEAGQLLTSLLVGLRSLEDSKDLEASKALSKRMREITAQAIDEVGRLARGLHPSTLDDHGLGAAISRYASEYTKTYKIRVQLSMDGLDTAKLPPPVEIALYRILQETLTNVARHARAKTARVSLKHSARALEMSVIDDGRGFDVSAVNNGPSRHLGIQSIRERSALLGGTATFRSGAGGTQVQVRIPLTGWKFPVVALRAGF